LLCASTWMYQCRARRERGPARDSRVGNSRKPAEYRRGSCTAHALRYPRSCGDDARRRRIRLALTALRHRDEAMPHLPEAKSGREALKTLCRDIKETCHPAARSRGPGRTDIGMQLDAVTRPRHDDVEATHAVLRWIDASEQREYRGAECGVIVFWPAGRSLIRGEEVNG
jgi:hypothetical protein